MPPQLTGVDPLNPRPKIRREFVFGAGKSLAPNTNRKVLIFGSKTSAGSETTDVIGTRVLSLEDLQTRAGRRSNIVASYREFVVVPQEAEIYFIAAPESAGTASSVVIVISGVSDANSVAEITVEGIPYTVEIPSGYTQTQTASAVAELLADADEGMLQVTAVAAIDGGGPDYKVTITAALKGPDGDNIIGGTTTRGIRVRMIGTNTQTITKDAPARFVAGTTDVDYTAAIAEAATGTYAEQIFPGTTTSGPTATDNGIGELLASIKSQALPSVGRMQILHFALVGTQAQQTTVCTDTDVNSVYARAWWDENCDWSPARIAAHWCAIKRANEMKHPSANFNGWTATDTQVCRHPPKYLKADRPTEAEIVACLNNGGCPISHDNGVVKLERHITTRALNSGSANDYRAREGHCTSAVDYAWSVFEQRYAESSLPFAAQDPVGTAPPLPRTMIPALIRSMVNGVIDDLTGPKPLGLFDGPILDPSPAAVQEMRDSIVVDMQAGKFGLEVDFKSVLHNLGLSALVRETQDAT